MNKQHRCVKRRKTTIFRRVASMFMLVMVLDGMLLLLLTHAGGVFTQIEQNALDILTEVTRNKYQTLNAKIINWSSLDDFSLAVNEQVGATLAAESKTYADIEHDAALNARIVENCAESMLSHARTTDTSGVFLILDGIGVPGDEDSRAGMYLRDYDTEYTTPTNSDLLLYRGLPPLSRSLSVGLDSYWQAAFRFENGSGNANNDYFYKPLLACREYEGTVAKYFGFWSGRFHMNPEDNIPIITYSRPLIASGGEVYGVVGVELRASYVDSVIGNSDYGDHSARTCFMLGHSYDGGQSYAYELSSGVRFRQNFYEEGVLTPENTFISADNTYIELRATRTGNLMTGSVCQIHLYDPNTPFSQEQWALIGLQENGTLYGLKESVQHILRTVIFLGLLLGMLIALIAAHRVAKPFSMLAGQLRGREHSISNLTYSGVLEADSLADTIMALSRSIEEEASRISKIISLSGMPIGAFEKQDDRHWVFCSDGFFKLLGCEELENPSGRISADVFGTLLRERLIPAEDEGEDVFVVRDAVPMRYLRMKHMHEERGELGTLIDVTREIIDRRRLQRERDFDLLTNLYNRRAFERNANELLRDGGEALKPVSALVMIDLDNLKVFNDVYGHDCGDLYIRTFADALLSIMKTERSLIARRSGDEFYLLYYGYPNKDAIRSIVNDAWVQLMDRRFTLPDGKEGKLHATAGIAWYPEDAQELLQLIHYADFAMYRVKNAAKGTVGEFRAKDYQEAGYLFNGSTALDRLIEERLVRFALQPIVNARDASVHGYELLMRPQVPELSTPDAVLSIARTQGKLNKVEWLTWTCGLETLRELRRQGVLPAGTRLFINSIPNQVMSKVDEVTAMRIYSDLMADVVMEITEGDRSSSEALDHKIDLLQENGGEIAIDDLGAGYNGEISLVNIEPTYIKLDMKLVRDIDRDENRQAIVCNMLQYASLRGILVIAEGVETRAEMETLCKLGVDYYQGYYLGRPQFEPKQPIEDVKIAVLMAANKWPKKGNYPKTS